jgi:predicted ABC-type ATPase
VSAGSVEESIRRIIERSYRGGHSASARLVREIYEKSTQNLFAALDFAESGIEVVRVYDNSEVGAELREVLTFRRGQPRSIARKIPDWNLCSRARSSKLPACEGVSGAGGRSTRQG